MHIECEHCLLLNVPTLCDEGELIRLWERVHSVGWVFLFWRHKAWPNCSTTRSSQLAGSIFSQLPCCCELRYCIKSLLCQLCSELSAGRRTPTPLQATSYRTNHRTVKDVAFHLSISSREMFMNSHIEILFDFIAGLHTHGYLKEYVSLYFACCPFGKVARATLCFRSDWSLVLVY